MTSDVIAQCSEYATEINDLKAFIDTTRRALDPEQLCAHVADNIDHFMGDITQKFARGLQINLDAAKANQNAASNTANANSDLKNKIDKHDMESRTLASITKQLKERDARSKWDCVTLAVAMLLAAALAGGGAVY